MHELRRIVGERILFVVGSRNLVGPPSGNCGVQVNRTSTFCTSVLDVRPISCGLISSKHPCSRYTV